MPVTSSSPTASIDNATSRNDEYVRFPLLDSEGRNWATYKERLYLSTVA
jgi:hypothetical protein